MPPSPRPRFLRAARRLRHPAAGLLVIAVLFAGGMPSSVRGVGLADAPAGPAVSAIPTRIDPPSYGGPTSPSPTRRAVAIRTLATLATASTLTTTPTPTPPGWGGGLNLYRAGSFVTQKTFKWCVAASVQMMVNLIRNHTDTSMKTQARMIAYAQLRDNGPYGEGGGTDVTGWTTALKHFGAGNYRAVSSTTAARALRVAATAMRQTGRPAGILVMDGRHAWVLHGFASRTDPKVDPRAWITSVWVSGPLYPLQQKGGYDPPPNTHLSIRALSRYFLPSSVGAAGKYVVIVPVH